MPGFLIPIKPREDSTAMADSPPIRRLGQVAFAPPGQEAYSWSDQVSPGLDELTTQEEVDQFVDLEGQQLLEAFCLAAQVGHPWARGPTHGSQAIFIITWVVSYVYAVRAPATTAPMACSSLVDKWFLDVEIIGKFISMISGSTLARGPPPSISSTSASGPSVLHLLEVIGKWLLYGAMQVVIGSLVA